MTKLVSAGYHAAASAGAAFCVIPITWVLIAVVWALVGLCAYMASASNHTAVLSGEMGKLCEKGDDLRVTDQLRNRNVDVSAVSPASPPIDR